ncbi:MAG: IS4 family transposase [bacterium]|nr:IS4 family transposase [bacterium]
MTHKEGRRGRKPKPAIKQRDIRGSKYVEAVVDLLAPLRSHRDCPNRRLHYDELVAYLLLYFFTPALDSMRGIQQMSDLKGIKKKLGLRRFSLGAFSEATHVFDPSLLEGIVEQLVGRLEELPDREELSALELAPALVDGTLLHALPRMTWALWLRDNDRAGKMHLEYDLLKGAPVRATLTEGNGDERKELREALSGGKLYVLDRGYADYSLMKDMLCAGSSFLVRVRENAAYEVLEERDVSGEAAEAGVERDVVAKLGCKARGELHGRRVRLLQVHVEDESARSGLKRQYRRKRVSSKKTFRTDKTDCRMLLATDLEDLDAELVCRLYRYRWQVELFFRWFKKVLEADRVLCESRNGMTIVMYCALIASILLRLWTGMKPTKRLFEMTSHYLSGWATEEELIAAIEKHRKAEERKRKQTLGGAGKTN